MPPRQLFAVLLVLLLAAAARIVNSSTWPIWTDEGASIYTASDPRITEIMDKLTDNHHPPLYFAVLGAWERVAGDARIALRMLTILPGMLAVAAVYRVGRDWFGHTAAWYGALLFAVSDLVVQYAQQVRHYGWLVLAVALMSLLFLRFLARPTIPRLIVYALSVTFMLYTHYQGVMALALQGVVGLLLWRAPLRDKKRLAAAWLLALVLYVPWLIGVQQILILLAERGLATRPNVAPTTLASLVEMVNVLANNQSALVVGLFALAVWRIWAQRDASVRWLARAYLVLCGGGMFVAMVVMNEWVRILTPRTLVFLTPALLPVAGYGLSLLPSRARGLLAGALALLTLATTDVIQPRIASDALARRLAELYAPGDLVVLETGADDNAFKYEIGQALRDGSATIIRTLPWVGTRGGVTPVVPQIEDDLQAHQRVWVVQWFQPSQVMPYLDGGGDGFAQALSEELSVGSEYDDLFGDNDIRLTLYERPNLSDAPLSFGDILALHGAVLSPETRAGEPLFIDLWWTALQPPPLDYSVGVFLLDAAGIARAEHNGPPGSTPTTQWTPGTRVFDRHALDLPADLAPGEYRIAVNAYWYGDLTPLAVDGAPLATVGEVQVRVTSNE